jgi:transcriptional regulator with XRE-family HTH domain
METIGDRVRRLREAKGIERKDLARDAGMSYSGLSDLESGKAKNTTKLHRLATLLDVNVNYLETGKGNISASATGLIDDESQVQRLDPEIVALTYQALDEAYKRKLNRPFNMVTDAAHFVQVLGFRNRLSHDVTQTGFIKILLETATEWGAEGNGRKGKGMDFVPAEGSDKSNMARRIRTKKH